MDRQFAKDNLDIRIGPLCVTLNAVAAEEHVPEIERHIRTLKDRARSVINTLPFARYPARMIIELVYYCGFWLNSFPATGWISDYMSPRSVILGTAIDYTHHCKLEYGTYVQTHEPHDNTMIPRTTGAIALRPTGNAQGGNYFFSLTSGRRLNRNHWTVLPMSADIVQRVDRLSRRPLGLATLDFADRTGVPIRDDDAPEPPHNGLDADDDDDLDADDDDDVPNTPPADYNSDDDRSIDPSIAGVRDDDDVELGGNDDANDNDVNEDDIFANFDNVNNLEVNLELEIDAQNNIVPAAPPTEVDVANPEPQQDIGEEAQEAILNPNDDDDEDSEDKIEIDVSARMDAKNGPRTGKYDLRARKPRDFGHMHTTIESIALTQHNVKKALSFSVPTESMQS